MRAPARPARRNRRAPRRLRRAQRACATRGVSAKGSRGVYTGPYSASLSTRNIRCHEERKSRHGAAPQAENARHARRATPPPRRRLRARFHRAAGLRGLLARRMRLRLEAATSAEGYELASIFADGVCGASDRGPCQRTWTLWHKTVGWPPTGTARSWLAVTTRPATQAAPLRG